MKAALVLNMLIFFTVLLALKVSSKGKTYDDLDDILKNSAQSKLEERDSHHAYVKPQVPGTVDKSKVVKNIVKE